MKKFNLIVSIICYVLVVISAALTIICACLGTSPVSFYVTNLLAMLAMTLSGTTCLIDYLDTKKLENARK